tara:strand:+ start:779 stop:1138 length:360 start_codon:yes stop_codon:yes gene_type:complete
MTDQPDRLWAVSDVNISEQHTDVVASDSPDGFVGNPTEYIRKDLYDVLWAKSQSHKLLSEAYVNRLNTLTKFIEWEFGCDLEGINNDDLHDHLTQAIDANRFNDLLFGDIPEDIYGEET